MKWICLFGRPFQHYRRVLSILLDIVDMDTLTEIAIEAHCKGTTNIAEPKTSRFDLTEEQSMPNAIA